MEHPEVTIAILAKDMAATLPLYLTCLEQLDYPKAKIRLYVRTNDNRDNTAEILREWLNKCGGDYADVYFDDSSVDPEIRSYQNHEWNCHRFEVLGKIRQASIQYAIDHQTHYLVVDCDNFIRANTLNKLVSSGKTAVAPFLIRESGETCYSNYHYDIDQNGYFRSSPGYYDIYHRKSPGFHEVGVIHCTYFLRREILDQIYYLDGSNRYEYVICAHSMRKAKIPQFLDNREIYGLITFESDPEKFSRETVARQLKALDDQFN